MFCIVILGAFAANASKATENNKPEPKISTVGHLSANNSDAGSFMLLLPPRTYSNSCGTWTVTGSGLSAEQEQIFSNTACANGWTSWYWNGTTLTQNIP